MKTTKKSCRLTALFLVLALLLLPNPGLSVHAAAAAQTTTGVNLRSGPSTGYSIYLTVPRGASITVHDTANPGWYKVSYGNYTGYMCSDYIRMSSAPPASAGGTADATGTARTTAVLNIRTGPSTGYRSLGLLANGATVDVLEKCGNGWYRVRTASNTYGYCSGDYLRVTWNTAATPQPTATPGTAATPKPTAKPTSQPAATRWNGKTTAYVNLRKGPSTGYSIYLTVPLGASITILDRSNAGWYKVQYGRYTGYMCADYIRTLSEIRPTATPQPTATPGTAATPKPTAKPTSQPAATRWNGRTTAYVNLRKGPSTGYSIYLTVPQSASVTVLDRSNVNWFKVQYKSYTGYMCSDYIKVLGAATPTPKPTPTPAATGTARTTAVLNIRTGPSTGYRSLGLLANGATVDVLEKCGNGWYRVRTASNTYGYCSGDYLRVTWNTAATPQPTAAPSAAPTPRPAGTVDTADLMLLVNPWNTIPADYTVSLVSIGDGESVDKRCYADLKQMLSDCALSGSARPYVCSGYRTNATQTRLYENKVDRLVNQGYSLSDARAEAAKSVAIPGTSEHQLGLAVDIVDLSYQVLDANQENTATQRWLMKNSWKYGFILRYPTGKTATTGIIYEPWHYRYVGRENAKAIYESGLCLEEYLKMQGK